MRRIERKEDRGSEEEGEEGGTEVMKWMIIL